MHDPCTVAFEIRSPFWEHKPWPKVLPYEGAPRSKRRQARRWEELTPAQQKGRSPHWQDGYRNSIVTIWHHDPERDGSDDSCGWSYPKLTPKQIERLKNVAWGEARNPYFLRSKSKEWKGTRHEAECLYRGLLLLVADTLDIPLTYEQAARHAARHIHHPDCVDPANVFCFLPGYHSNFEEDRREHREDAFHGTLIGIAKQLLRNRRPWWRHPKWHVHHWRIQIRVLGDFKRWAFSRCCKCGKRFPWGYCPVSNRWHGTGPRWFRGEPDVMHHECANRATGQAPQQPATATA